MAPRESYSETRPDSDGGSDTDTLRLHRLQKRKSTKIMVEKRRRERIDSALCELKHLVLASLNKNPDHYVKMEKADIMDMAVEFLRRASSRDRIPAQSAPVNLPPHGSQSTRYTGDIRTPVVLHPAVCGADYTSCRQEVRRCVTRPMAPTQPTSRFSENLTVRIPTSDTVALNSGRHTTKLKSNLTDSHIVSPTNRLLQVAKTHRDSGAVWRPW